MAQFEELEVWKRSARLSVQLYKALAELRDFGFRDQLTRAGSSVASNIAEGYGRLSPKDTLNFLSYAKGSAGEARTQIFIGMEIGYIEKKQGRAWLQEVSEISRMLHGLIHARKAGRCWLALHLEPCSLNLS